MKILKKKMKIFRYLLALLFVVPFFLFAGSTPSSENRYSNLELFAKVLNLIQKYYVSEVDAQKLIYGGINGMLKALDPHTSFLTPDVYKNLENETHGQFGGLGVEVTVQDDFLTIISPIEDTPAWKAGLKAGDKIVSINGKSTKGMSLVQSSQLMRGEKGKKIVLEVLREGLKSVKKYKIKRGVVKIKSVKMISLDNGYAYIRLTSFIENSSRDLRKALDKIRKTKKKIKGIILDVRNNPGGLLEESIKISNIFLDQGKIVKTVGRDKKNEKIVTATSKDSLTHFPIVVLINEYSASASEILAGALKDNKRALIVGQRSFGKGSVQSVVKLGDGSGLKMTVARYYTPNGVSIQARGIEPDIFVDQLDGKAFKKAIVKKQVYRESDIDGHLSAEKKGKLKSQFQWWNQKKSKLSSKDKLLSDFQVHQAYNYLKAYKTMQK